MSPIPSLFNKIKLKALFCFGISYEFSQSDYVSTDVSIDIASNHVTELDINKEDIDKHLISYFEIHKCISKGWYMLEVEGNTKTLGANFCLSGNDVSTESLSIDGVNKLSSEIVHPESHSCFVKNKFESELESIQDDRWQILVGSHLSLIHI